MANEKRLIDANELSRKKKYSFQTVGGCFPKSEWFVKLDDVFSTPTVDAVEVVRCKDCEHSKPITILNENRVQLHCRMQYGLPCVEPDEYCSRGERRNNETEEPV